MALELHFGGQVWHGSTEYDGFFRFEWKVPGTLPAGWHEVTITCRDKNGALLAEAKGSILVPHITQYAFISDIDDTILYSYSSTVFRRLYELLFHNPERRRIFRETAAYYRLLTAAHTEPAIPNPLFYVSSSEWNLYDYLRRIFRFNDLPEGIFLLDQVKRWYQLLQTGKTGHSGKLIRISRILQAFPRQRIVLLGDNSQRDPEIYKAIATKYPGQIRAVYIREVRPSKTAATLAILESLEASGVEVCFFRETREAIAHGRRTGLIV